MSGTHSGYFFCRLLSLLSFHSFHCPRTPCRTAPITPYRSVAILEEGHDTLCPISTTVEAVFGSCFCFSFSCFTSWTTCTRKNFYLRPLLHWTTLHWTTSILNHLTLYLPYIGSPPYIEPLHIEFLHTNAFLHTFTLNHYTLHHHYTEPPLH